MPEPKHYTWEEKIDNLAAIAKAVGVYIEAEEGLISPSTGHAYYHDAQRKLRELYSDFCDWRHEEPYVVDEIKALMRCDPTYTSAMDMLAMTTIALLLPGAYGTREIKEGLELLRKLVQSCLELAAKEEEA